MATPSISRPTDVNAVLHAGDDALDLGGAFAGVLGAQRGVAALADQAVDLAVEPANGIADQLRCLPGRFGEILHFAGDDRKAAPGGARARGLDGRVQGQQIGLPRDRLDRSGDLCDIGQRRADRAQPMLDAADGFDQFGDMLDRGFDRGARLRDFADGCGRRRLHRLRGAGDAVIGGDHGLGGLLQMAEPVGLAGDAARDFLQIAGDVGELDAEAADPIGELIDQPFADRRHSRRTLRFSGHSLYAVRKPPQWRPLTRIGTSISRIMTVLPLPMSRA